jgi:hypothetical protein
VTISATVQETANRPAAQGPVLFGRFMLPDMSEHPCQVSDLTSSSATFHSEHVPPVGLPIVAYLEELGRVEALSAEPVEGGFKIVFSLKGARLEKLETRLKWLGHKQRGNEAEGRRHARFEPRDSKSQITLPDGRVYTCEVLDISVSGAGIRVEVMPSLGTYVMLGKMRGRVVRHLEHGLAIEFAGQLDSHQLGSLV